MEKIVSFLKDFSKRYRTELVISGSAVAFYYLLYVISLLAPEYKIIEFADGILTAVFFIVYGAALFCGCICYPISLYKTGEYTGTWKRTTTYEDGRKSVEYYDDYANAPFEFTGFQRYFVYGWLMGLVFMTIILVAAIPELIVSGDFAKELVPFPIDIKNGFFSFIVNLGVIIAFFSLPYVIMEHLLTNSIRRRYMWHTVFFAITAFGVMQIPNAVSYLVSSDLI